MRWGVEYEQNDGGMIGLLLFSADDMQAANDYVEDMCKKSLPQCGFSTAGVTSSMEASSST